MAETIVKYGDSEDEKMVFSTRNISIIGGNGSGKSSLMRKIQQINSTFTIVSAHKNLTIKQGQYREQDDDWLTKNKSHFINPKTGGANRPLDNNSVQDDFNQMIEIVFRDYTDESVEAFNSGKTLGDITRKLDKIFAIWNSIFTERIILYKEKKLKVQVAGEETFYDIENLSDGERSALYILIKVVLADAGTTVVIDEPETFLNPSILNHLFDECEKLKHDSMFIYFSHDLEFVTTRKNNTIFWIKEYRYPQFWKILYTDPQEIPEEWIVKVVGAKKQKILFVESDKNKDSQLYQLIYPDFKVWAVGSCENVINFTKAFNSRTEKFNKEYFGLIDRDLKTDAQIAGLKDDRIFCLPVAVYENLFLANGVVRFVFDHLGRKDFDAKFSALEAEVRQSLDDEGFKIAYKRTKIQQLFNINIESIAKGALSLIPDMAVYDAEIRSFDSKDHEQILKVFNQKSIKGCVQKLDYGWIEWQNQVLNLFNTDKVDGMRKEFLKTMPDIV